MTVTVDLDQLREASVDEHSVWEAAQAVLSAPVVWWCEGHPEDMCEASSPHDPPLPCRMVALVPVAGERR